MEAVVDGRMQLWVILEGPDVVCCFMTEIITYPRLRALRFVGCVGRGFRRWVHLRAEVENWGRELGCKISEGMVPDIKWRHLFDGYSPDHQRLTRAL